MQARRSRQLPESEGRNCYKARSGPPLPIFYVAGFLLAGVAVILLVQPHYAGQRIHSGSETLQLRSACAPPLTRPAYVISLHVGWQLLRDKGMQVLQVWSDAHRETSVDVFDPPP
jgi:hypothetical protein